MPLNYYRNCIDVAKRIGAIQRTRRREGQTTPIVLTGEDVGLDTLHPFIHDLYRNGVIHWTATRDNKVGFYLDRAYEDINYLEFCREINSLLAKYTQE